MMSDLKGKTYDNKPKELEMDTLEQRREDMDMDMVQVFKILNGEDKERKETWFRLTSKNSCQRNAGII